MYLPSETPRHPIQPISLLSPRFLLFKKNPENPIEPFINPTSPLSPHQKKHLSKQPTNKTTIISLHLSSSKIQPFLLSSFQNGQAKSTSNHANFYSSNGFYDDHKSQSTNAIHKTFVCVIFPSEDPFRILEQTPLTIPKSLETIALARSDWKETATAHVLSLDIPGLKKDDIKIEVIRTHWVEPILKNRFVKRGCPISYLPLTNPILSQCGILTFHHASVAVIHGGSSFPTR
ncbi:hypothetical protein Ddye_004471 [Dipteronia dyeriana]|uniref:Uncharacterized protein n=1 Tax=Dipteronia dyeriana TaxID=168575 RepID=A0AAD9XVR7_9ROSI|nr:hypothetical protein Ddye_004471 [Dipteronia dyeriana]